LIKCEKTLAELEKVLDADFTNITAWNRQARDEATGVFGPDDALAPLEKRKHPVSTAA